MVGAPLLAIGQHHTNGAIILHHHLLHPRPQTQRAAMGLQPPHQGRHHGRTAATGKVKAGFRIKPFTEQGRHRRGVGVSHRHAADQEAEQIHPMAQEGILQMAVHQRAEGTTEMAQGGQVGQQATTAPQQRPQAFEPMGRKRQQGQGVGRCSDRLQHRSEATPFLHHRRPTQVGHHPLKPLRSHTDAQVPLGKQHIPVAIRHHLQGLVQRPQDLRQGIGTRPSAQATPERRA